MTQSYSSAELVDHPSHYGGADDVYEHVKVAQATSTPQEFAGYLKNNATKYLQRHAKKGRMIDVEKALWYVSRLHQFLLEVGYDAVYPPAQSSHVHVQTLSTAEIDEVLKKNELAEAEECRNAELSRLALTVEELAGRRAYADFFRSVATSAKVPRHLAKATCLELGYDVNGKKMRRARGKHA